MANIDQLLDSNTYEILNAPSYPLAEASRLVGISKGRISRWLRGYKYSYALMGGVQIEKKKESVVQRTRRNESTQVSFLELIDLLFVKRFLDKNFTLQYIRKLLDDSYQYLDTPHFASARFITRGKEVFLGNKTLDSKAKFLIKLLTDGQHAFPEIIEPMGEQIDFEDVTGFSLATRWYPSGKDGDIVVDPQISFGQPTLIGHRITTANLFDLYLGEEKKIDKVSGLFGLPINKVNSAIEFEYSINT